jgi:sodium/pantothenate symporter
MNFMLVLPSIIALVVVFAVVEYFKRKASTVEGFYVANRGINIWLLTGTYVASWVSITGMMGYASLAFRKGIAFNMWTWGFWGVVFFTFLVGLPLRKVAKYSHELIDDKTDIAVNARELLTPPDFFQLRFPSKWVRGISSIMLIGGLTFYAVGQLIGMSLAMSFLGVGYGTALIVCTVVLIWTTIRAGTPGVIVNDTINMFTFVFAVFLLIPFALSAVGGIDNLVAITSKAKPGMWSDGGYQNTIFLILSFNLIWNFMTAGSPHLVQRAYTAKSDKVFLKAQIIGVFIVITWAWFLYISTQTGLVLFPDLPAKESDSILPLVAIKVLPTFLAGVIIAAIFAVGFSTINTQVSNMAFCAARDIYQTLFKPDISEKNLLIFTKWMIAVLSIVVALFAWTKPWFIAEITTWGIAFYGACYVPMFVCGFYWKRANATGILSGISSGSIVFIILGVLKFTGVYNLPYGIHPFLITLPLTVLVIVVVSLMTEQSEQERKVAVRISEVVARKSDEPTTGSDYAIPVVVIILSLVVMMVLFRMFS